MVTWYVNLKKGLKKCSEGVNDNSHGIYLGKFRGL